MASVGDLWIVDFGEPYPGEPAKHRPALVLGPPESYSAALPFVVVSPLTTTNRNLPVHIEVDATDETGLTETSFVQCELVRSISRQRLVHPIGQIDPVTSAAVRTVIRSLLGHQ